MNIRLLVLTLLAVAPFQAWPQTVAEAQKQALAKYPELGREGSPLHTQFKSLYAAVKQSDPKFLSHPNWPLILADRASLAILQTQNEVFGKTLDGDPFVEFSSTPAEGKATWVMRSECSSYMEKQGAPPRLLSELAFYIKSDSRPPTRAFSGTPSGWRLMKSEISKVTELLKKFPQWTQVAQKNKVNELRKEIGRIKGPSGETALAFDVRSDQSSAIYSLLILNGNGGVQLEERPLDSTDVSAILELLGKAPALDAKLQDKILHPNGAAKDALFK